jgi:DNA (cytosine-5)-methyltransferase 1
MRYLSVCSGIEAASVAWHPLGWTPIGFSEIEPFPSAVLAHHYPKVKNYGDMSKFRDWSIRSGDIDLLVGGTPCQSFSIAGLRQGLKDPRGNLMLTFLAIAEHLKPKWIVWENVPGVLSSNGGKDFGSFLGGLGELGYGFAYRILDAQWCRTHGHPRAVPQRRRRVFVVGCAGDHIGPAKVLFEQESMLRYSATRSSSRQGTSADVASCLRSGGDGGVPSSRGEHLTFSAPIASTLNASFADKQGLEDQHALNGAPCFVIDVPVKQPTWWDGEKTANTLTKSNSNGTQRMPDKDNFGALLQPIYCGSNPNASDTVTSKWQKQSGGPAGSECGLFVLQPITAILFENHPNDSRITGPHDVAPSCVSRYGTGGGNVPLVIPIQDSRVIEKNQNGIGVGNETSPAYTIDQTGAQAVAIQGTVIGRQDHNGPGGSGCSDTGEMYTLTSQDTHAVAIVGQVDWRTTNNDAGQVSQTLKTDLAHQSGPCLAVAPTMQVRRLTPTECERLQGFPDGWTAIPWKKKNAEDCPDGPRYKALGNSMAVNCMEWLGERIQKFDQSSLCQLP